MHIYGIARFITPPFDIHSFGCRLCLTYFGGLLFPIDFQKPGGIIALLDEAW